MNTSRYFVVSIDGCGWGRYATLSEAVSRAININNMRGFQYADVAVVP